MAAKTKCSIQDDPTLREAMAEILLIQPRCSVKPVFGITGKGELKSEGVAELQDLIRTHKTKSSPK